MLEPLDFVIIGLIGFLTFLAGAFVTLKLAKPALLKSLRGVGLAVGNQVSKSLAETIENVDVGEILGQIGGEEGEGNPLGAFSGLLGGKSGGVGEIIATLSKLGGSGGETKGFKPGK